MPPNNTPYPPNPAPQQPAPPPPAQPMPPGQPSGQFDSGQFDFIMSPQKPKKSLLPGGPKMRMILMVTGVAVVAIVLILIVLSMFSGGSSNTEQLVKVAQQQNEIIRISTEASKKAGGEKTKILATLTSSTITTDQKKVIDYLAKNKKKLKNKELTLLTSKKTDAELTAAAQNGRYDEVSSRIITTQLTDYQTMLQSSYTQVGPKGKEMLEQSFSNVSLILKDNKTL